MRIIKEATLFLTTLVLVLFYTDGVGQTSVTAIALFKDKAMLSINGQRAKIVSAGNAHKGVILISSTTSEAVIDVDGKRETLTLNGTTTVSDELGSFSQQGNTKVEIRENEFGFFENSGTVNGRRINFLVDTGANLVVLSSNQADSMGLNYLAGIKGIASTASGNAIMYTINLDTVTLGGIQVNDVQAGIIEGAFPEKALLGMTFLRKVDMTRSGRLMTLTAQ